jgi:hypothetical protein
VVEPDQALAALVDLVLVADGAERKRRTSVSKAAWVIAMRIMAHINLPAAEEEEADRNRRADHRHPAVEAAG